MQDRPHPFLKRLLRDRSANTLVIMTMAMIPLAGMVGGALDASRLYLSKTRLQHACDAGALAGRRQMGAGTWAANNNRALQKANEFFTANFKGGVYGTNTGSLTRSFTEAGGRVTGTATVAVPMTLMRVLGVQSSSLTVNCDADLRLPNTDIMFVLDTTGSMEQTLGGDSQTKIAGLRTAVLCFYEIIARLDTNAACEGTAPSGGTGGEVQIRFGFVPYASNVNVGGLLPTAFMADRRTYQTRVANFLTPVAGEVTEDEYEAYNVGGQARAISAADCVAFGRNQQFDDENDGNRRFSPSAAGDSGSGNNLRRTTYQNNGNGSDWGYVNAPVADGTFRTCRRRRIESRVGTQRFAFTNWTYQQREMDMSAFKLRGAVNFADDACLETFNDGRTFCDPRIVPLESYIPGTTAVATTIDERDLATLANTDDIPLRTRTWDGCVEERATVSQATYTPIPSGARDLDIDSAPTSDAATQWGTTLPNVVYPRGTGNADSAGEWRTEAVTTTRNYGWPYYQCPTAARGMQTWPTANAFQTYVNGLTTDGNTYHDIGLLWGARLLSPTGIFGANNATTPQGASIERHMIFMTDGETCTGPGDYVTYGVEWFDRRRTGTNVVPTGRCETTNDTGGNISEQVNARTLALCDAVRNKNITLWVVWFGESKPWLETRLQGCATPGRFFTARNGADLQTRFRTIANQISQLRLTL